MYVYLKGMKYIDCAMLDYKTIGLFKAMSY